MQGDRGTIKRAWIGVQGIALVLGMTQFFLAAAVAEDLRTWSDSTGRFKIQAKFVAFDGTKVTLEREDGSQFEIELKRLSAADQKVARDLANSDDPFKPAAPADPFRPKSAGAAAPAGGGAGSEPAVGSEPRSVTPDWSNAQMVSIAPTQTDWSLPAPTQVEPAVPAKLRAVPLPPKSNFFEGITSLVINGPGTRAVVGYKLDDPKPEGTTRIVLCDLEKGKMLGQAKTSGLFAPLALSDDGNSVVMRSDVFGFGNSNRLELWTLTSKGIARTMRWSPYDDVQGGDRDVKWGAYLDEKRFATVSGGGKLAIWDAATAQPQSYMMIQKGCLPALSPDRKFLAFASEKEYGLLDVTADEVVASTPVSQTQWATMLFSPTGQQFACAAFDRVFVHDTATGKLIREMPYNGLPVQPGNATWPSEGYILVGHRFLLDVVNQVKLWEYTGAEQTKAANGLCWFEVAPSQNAAGALVPAKVPAPTVLSALKQAMADPNFFVLKPGTTVTIDTSGLADPAQRPKVEAVLTQKLQADGMKVGPNGSITLQAQTEVGQERKVSYHTFGQIGSREYTVREHFSRVRFVYQGKPAWENSAGNIPMFVSLNEDQTMKQYLQEHERPNYDYFSNVGLPKLLTRPSGAGSQTLGTSQVSVAGVR